MGIVTDIYRVTSRFPKHEQYALANQMHRAAASVPSNLAEGHALESTRDYLRHISIARGSLAELDTQLEIALRLGYLAESTARPLQQRLADLGKGLSALRNSLSKYVAEEVPGYDVDAALVEGADGDLLLSLTPSS
jgi:four helix bundle protein